MIEFYPHQKIELEETQKLNKVAYYHEMGLGKTFVGAEKMIRLGERVNLVICQKSKIEDWIEHFKSYYDVYEFNLTEKKDYEAFIAIMNHKYDKPLVAFINYELAFRRKDLLKLEDFTLMLDESSLIQNEMAKRSKFILKMKPKNIILLSGTPTSGRYENLWSQLHLLGWGISKDLYWKQYVDVEYIDGQGFPIKIVKGYKNVDRLKSKMKEYGCRFLKSSEVFDLPEQTFNKVKVDTTKEYRKFKKDRLVTVNNREFVGDTILSKMLYERMLCGSYNQNKLKALEDLIESTEDRLIIFYNFNEELYAIEDICIKHNRPMAIVNGNGKDLSLYDGYSNSVTAIQYQSGAMGLNLQKANKIIYFTPPLSSELFEQSKKRIHRIGQKSSCFYYMLICKNSIEEKIYNTLAMRKNYTEALFERDE